MINVDFVNLHRHGHHSQFDGYGKAIDAARHAKEMGQNALGLTDHGTMSGCIEHYKACNEVGIKPIIGVEAYFMPEFEKDNESYHLCLFAMSVKGYQNICKMMTRANESNYYYKAYITFDLLEAFNEDVICTSACIAGYPAKLISNGKVKTARKVMRKFKSIFSDRYYVEIMPYHVDGLDQEGVNEKLIELADELDIECIVTCDSHYTSSQEYDTYMIMHKIAGHKDIADYSERYMPNAAEVQKRMYDMHGKTKANRRMVTNTQRLADRCDVVFDFKESVPKFDWGMPSRKKLFSLVKQGLKETNRWEKKYIERAKYELKVICDDLGFEDYFLLCYDIIKFANDNNIAVGPGRGSVCGSLVANAIGITKVDPLVMGTDFERFLRPDKKKLPDIDMDFGQADRGKVLEYIMERHHGRAAQITTFGYYRTKNLVNDLIKAMEVSKEDGEAIKSLLEKEVPDERGSAVDFNALMRNRKLFNFNKKYDGIIKHFCRLNGQVRFIGKHAAGVAITVGPIDDRVALMKRSGVMQTCLDLNDLGVINVLKMDILGLATASIMKEIEETSGKKINWNKVKSEKVFKAFREGKTEAIFQFEKGTAKEILERIECDSIDDIMAANALNRPAPLQLGVLDQFVEAKLEHTENKKNIWYEYTKDAYGTIIFQEHVMRICRNIAHMEWQDVDKVMKSLKQSSDEDGDPLKEKFVKGAMKYSKMKKEDASQLYDRITLYSFNKGHCAAYSLISYKMMECKLRTPLDFWCATLKFESEERKREAYKCCAVRDGCVIMLPHVNGAANYEIRDFKGDNVIYEGLSAIKGIGPKAAEEIVANAPYIDKPDFEERVSKRVVNKKVMALLEENGALEFREKFYVNRVVAYNRQLYAKKIRIF